jgi:hypothetical protein
MLILNDSIFFEKIIYATIQCCGSVTFWYGFVPQTYGSDPTPDPAPDPAIFFRDFQDGNEKLFISHKEVTNRKESRLFLLFFLDDKRMRSRIRILY